ncbi:hypothetical protein WJX72_000732 [[Myrmecia] bisecta]|uniref:ADP-ribosylation factor-like protein 2-binding protein n=1 Tax=[Myrmecia] bisecta TaxID=41462 RepID=A0AAW1Q0W7_9CHLO
MPGVLTTSRFGRVKQVLTRKLGLQTFDTGAENTPENLLQKDMNQLQVKDAPVTATEGADMCFMGADGETEVIADDEAFADGMEEDDVDFSNDGASLDPATRKFDRIVGALEDILMDASFEQLQHGFCTANCSHFEDTEENKLVYTQLFNQYTELIEQAIDTRLAAALPDFSMDEFLQMLACRQEELMGDIFDLLLSLSDFQSFKEMMVDYSKAAAGLGSGIEVIVRPLTVHTDEQEDGDWRPDLDCELHIEPATRHPSVAQLGVQPDL